MMASVRVEPTDDVIYQPLQDEIVLLNMKDQRYFGLDDVGSDMWKLLVEIGDMEAVVERLCSDYDVDRTTVQRDLGSLVDDLIAAGLMKVSDAQKQPL